jgi:hypothetical protein
MYTFLTRAVISFSSRLHKQLNPAAGTEKLEIIHFAKTFSSFMAKRFIIAPLSQKAPLS